MHAETAYLFRHALLRDAAYQLQLPLDRAKLHALVPDICETLMPGMLDELALELADHARIAAEALQDGDELRRLLLRREVDYLVRASQHAHRLYRLGDCTFAASRLITHSAADAAERAQALYLRGLALARTGRSSEAETDYSYALKGAQGAARLDVLFALGNLMRGTSRYRESEQFFSAAQALAEEQLREHIAGAMGGRALILGLLGDIAGAEDLFTRSLALEAPPLVRARMLHNRTVHRQNTGLWRESIPDLEEALAICLQEQDQDFESVVRGGLGLASKMLGRLDDAREQYCKAIDLARACGNRRQEGVVRGNLGEMLSEAGELGDAEHELIGALAIHQETGDLRFEANVTTSLATLAELQGKSEVAASYHQLAIEKHRRVRNLRGLGIALGNSSCFERERGYLEEAVRIARQAVEVLEQAADPISLAMIRGQLAEHLCLSGRHTEASALLPQIEDGLRNKGLDSVWCEYALMPRLHCALAAANRPAAEEIMAQFQKSGHPRWMNLARELLDTPPRDLVNGFALRHLPAALRRTST